MPQDIMWKKRLQKVGTCVVALVLAGIGYGLWVQRTGLAVPCLMHLVTGLKCPSCGVTGMCVALMQLDFATAYQRNQVLFVLAPVLGIVFFKYLMDYIKTGKWQLNRLQKGILYVSIAILVIFGIVRNILSL